MNSNHFLRFLLPVAFLCAAANASTIFNFDGDSLGTSTGFTDTVNGLSATFSSSADPGGFVVYASMFETLTGNVLGDPGPAFLDNLNLDIGFSADLAAITLNFATSDFITPSPFTLTAFENSTQVGTATSPASFCPGSLSRRAKLPSKEGRSIMLSSRRRPPTSRSTISTWSRHRNLALSACWALDCCSRGLLPGGGAMPYANRHRFKTNFQKETNMKTLLRFLCPGSVLAILSLATTLPAQTILPLLPPSVSTVPANGDVNPYGVFFVPKNVIPGWTLQPGDILVSNFNNSQNLQGTGTTITRVDKNGNPTTFFRAVSPG